MTGVQTCALPISNRTGEPPATEAAACRAAFPGRLTDAAQLDPARTADILLIDGGPTPGPVPSTILSLAGEHALAPVVLREGVLSRAELAAVLDPVLEAAGASGPCTNGDSRA